MEGNPGVWTRVLAPSLVASLWASHHTALRLLLLLHLEATAPHLGVVCEFPKGALSCKYCFQLLARSAGLRSDLGYRPWSLPGLLGLLPCVKPPGRVGYSAGRQRECWNPNWGASLPAFAHIHWCPGLPMPGARALREAHVRPPLHTWPSRAAPHAPLVWERTHPAGPKTKQNSVRLLKPEPRLSHEPTSRFGKRPGEVRNFLLES